MTSTLPRVERLTPPGPPRTATFRLLRWLVSDRLRLMSSAAESYGDAVRMAIGPKTLYFFNHPELAKHVLSDNAANYHKGIGLVQAKRALGDGLLTSGGDLWRKQRKTIAPTFQRKRIAEQARVVTQEAHALIGRLRAGIGTGPALLTDELTTFTLGVLGRTLLDADLSTFDSIGHSFEAVQDQAMFEMVTLSMVPLWSPLPKQRRFRKARRDLEQIVRTLVAERDARPGPATDDVLSTLIESTRAETDPEIGRVRLRDELVTLLLAGHETTASTLSWTHHLLGEHPEVAQRVREEALRVLGDRDPVFEDLHRLSYTTQVVQEAMRLYPPVWMLPRLSLAEDNVGGFHVPSNVDVVVCPYTMHRHPDLWANPTAFDPDRFHPDNIANRSRYAYIPFGAGPRFCVGNSLGMMEAVFVTAMISRELSLHTQPGYAVVPEPMLSLRVRGGLPMIVRTTE
jgi:cytochrome P450